MPSSNTHSDDSAPHFPSFLSRPPSGFSPPHTRAALASAAASRPGADDAPSFPSVPSIAYRPAFDPISHDSRASACAASSTCVRSDFGDEPPSKLGSQSELGLQSEFRHSEAVRSEFGDYDPASEAVQSDFGRREEFGRDYLKRQPFAEGTSSTRPPHSTAVRTAMHTLDQESDGNLGRDRLGMDSDSSDDAEPASRVFPVLKKEVGESGVPEPLYHPDGTEMNMFEAAAARRRAKEHPDLPDLNLEGRESGYGFSDDDDDDEELIVSSSFLHPGTKEFTKLEVMSARKIRSVINFFHGIVVVAFLVALTQLIWMAKTSDSATLTGLQAVIPLNYPGLMGMEDFRKGVALEADFRFNSITNDEAGGRLESIFAVPGIVNMVTPGVEDYAQDGSFLNVSMRGAAEDFLEKNGITLPDGVTVPPGFGLGGKDDVLGHFPGISESVKDDAKVFGSGRDSGKASSKVADDVSDTGGGEDDDEEVPFQEETGTFSDILINTPAKRAADEAAGGIPVMPSIGASKKEMDVYKVKVTNWLLENDRGPNSPNPASFIAVKTYIPTVTTTVGTHVVNLVMSCVAVLLALVFVVRLTRLGRAKITHEQIWVVVLLVLVCLYWNAVDSLSVLDTQLNLVSALRSEEENARLLSVGKPGELFLPKWWESIRGFCSILREPAWSGIIFFYSWISLHSYRILDPSQHLSFWSFYFPKLLLLVPYIMYKALAHPALNIWLSEIPFVSIIVWGRHYHAHRLNVWAALRTEFLYSVGAALIEFVITSIILMEGMKTSRVLRRVKYMKYRTKQIGFRFFVYMNVVFYSASAFLQFVFIMAIPSGQFIYPLLSGEFNLKTSNDWGIAPSILLFGYAIVEAYVKLPKEAIGIKGLFFDSRLGPSSSSWSRSSRGSVRDAHQSIYDDSVEAQMKLVEKKGNGDTPHSYIQVLGTNQDLNSAVLQGREGPLSSSTNVSSQPRSYVASTNGPDVKLSKFVVDHDSELNCEIAEPVRYRKRESTERLELRANSFTMETHVMMFNFSWYVYYHGTYKAKKINPADADRFKVFAHVANEETDTHALVIDSEDRIIVAFRGTTSKRNLQTSLQIYHESLSAVLPTNIDEKDETRRLTSLFGRAYTNAKVHKGFAIAYRSVAHDVMVAIRTLLVKRKRPVFFCGHSLGASLATLCSLDAWIKLDLNRREIFVSTFGSPRVGNDLFREVYKSCVPLHWRIVVTPDMITKMPKVGYRHVGKKVTLTPYGRLLIDPNMLEQLHWSNNSSGFAYHRKASYLLAMRAWCVMNHGKSYVPNFWPFPVSGDDERRFQSALVGPSVYSPQVARASQKNRIIELDAMVDALRSRDHDADDENAPDFNVVELWGRLARRALLKDTLQQR